MTTSSDNGNQRQVGRSEACELVLDDDSVSDLHARVELTPEGYIAVRDNESRNGTHLHRNGRWVQVRRIILGTGDRVRFGDAEVSLEQLLALFGRQVRVRLREGGESRPKVVFDRPRRNPLTGKIEEQVDL